MKVSEQTGNGSGIMLLHFPDGSTLQWGVRRGFLCCFIFVLFIYVCVADFYFLPRDAMQARP